MTIAEAVTVKLNAGRCELGEGPNYDRHSNTAWWFDIVDRKLLEHQFNSGMTVTHELPCMGSVIARIDAQRQLVAMEDGLYVRQIAEGRLTRIAELEADNPVTRSNDGRVHPSGRLWIGTMGRNAEDRAGAIYWSDGVEVRSLYREISIPNSICFSPDGCTGFFADTKLNTVWRVTLNPQDGMPKGEPEVFLTAANLPLGGSFDGSVTDTNGVLWNASWGGGAISGFAPDGTHVRTYEVPAAQTSCPVFVGRELDKMLVTTAWQGYSRAEWNADPGAGYTFVLDGKFNGLAETEFRLPEDLIALT